MHRRTLIALCTAVTLAGPALAQTFPTKPIKLVIAFPAGGPTDITMRAVVHDVPMDAVYADEESSLKVSKVLPEFMVKHVNRFFKRYVYLYLLRDFNIGSLYSLLGVVLCGLGVVFGGWAWLRSLTTGQPATSGTVMLAALPLIIGIQFLIAFLHHDVERVPSQPLSEDLTDDREETPAARAG